jgi:hypothetical protein
MAPAWNSPFSWLPWTLYAAGLLGLVPLLFLPWWGRGMWFRAAYALKPLAMVGLFMPEFFLPDATTRGGPPLRIWPWLPPLGAHRLWLGPLLGGAVTVGAVMVRRRRMAGGRDWNTAEEVLLAFDVLRWASALLIFSVVALVPALYVAVTAPLLAALASLATLGQARRRPAAADAPSP